MWAPHAFQIRVWMGVSVQLCMDDLIAIAQKEFGENIVKRVSIS